ncbi:hypothetical protein [Pedobacter sp. CFBP9032]|uniref:hypothetical protein n=1 Tax=Pedobacter sp. CFBP9032 TaxID=3096539 RepID=UPI002A6A869B|nr:hypothetical protein [Pedobacter sp. CFBP9032]MDY0906871.1 hypothetical protein [Pedobacter sp. CFBP9032]
MENCVISHFGVFEVESHAVSGKKTFIDIQKAAKYCPQTVKSSSQLKDKNLYQWFFNLLFRKLF